MARKIRKICWKLGIPLDKKILISVGVISFLFFVVMQFFFSNFFQQALAVSLLRQAIFNKTGQNVPVEIRDGNLWIGSFDFSFIYEKDEGGRVTRIGEFNGKISFDQGKKCWQVSGSTREPFNIYHDFGVREIRTRSDCTLSVTIRQ